MWIGFASIGSAANRLTSVAGKQFEVFQFRRRVVIVHQVDRLASLRLADLDAAGVGSRNRFRQTRHRQDADDTCFKQQAIQQSSVCLILFKFMSCRNL